MNDVQGAGEAGAGGRFERLGEHQKRLTGAPRDDHDHDPVGETAVVAPFAGDVGELALPRYERAAEQVGEACDQGAVSRAVRGSTGVPGG